MSYSKPQVTIDLAEYEDLKITSAYNDVNSVFSVLLEPTIEPNKFRLQIQNRRAGLLEVGEIELKLEEYRKYVTNWKVFGVQKPTEK